MVHRRLSYGKPAAEILKMAAGIGADMIIMGSPSSSNFRRLIEKSPCSLVLVKDKDPTFVMD
jgi:nucleotide-binding universal stress UspA family protein